MLSWHGQAVPAGAPPSAAQESVLPGSLDVLPSGRRDRDSRQGHSSASVLADAVDAAPKMEEQRASPNYPRSAGPGILLKRIQALPLATRGVAPLDLASVYLLTERFRL